MRSRLIVSTVATVALLAAGAPADAAFPGRNGDIAFGRSSGHQVDIWAFEAGGAPTRRLTDTPNKVESMPDWNASGTRLAYVRCAGGKTGNCDIFAIDADGSDRSRITSTPDVQETWPAWSPTGAQIAYTSNAQDSFQDIWVMDANGSNQTRLTTTAGFDAFPEWSPDGQSIAFTSDRAAADDIWVMDDTGTNPVRLTSGPRVDERPDWAPDGSRIVFSRNGNIWVMDDNGQNETQLTRFEAGRIRPCVRSERATDRLQPARQRRPHRHLGDA